MASAVHRIIRWVPQVQGEPERPWPAQKEEKQQGAAEKEKKERQQMRQQRQRQQRRKRLQWKP